MKGLDNFTGFIIAFFAGLIVGIVLAYTIGKPTEIRPVEGNDRVDSLTKANDSIKIVVTNLDSIKNAKIIEVQTLDNDSTIKLFYQLIGK